MKTRHWGLMATSALALTTAMAHAARAQTSPLEPLPPVHSLVDANGVDLSSGLLSVTGASVTIGDPRQGGLSWVSYGRPAQDNLTGAINASADGSTVTVSMGSSSRSFSQYTTGYIPDQRDGSTLSVAGALYTLTMHDGTVAVFSTQYADHNGRSAALAKIISEKAPDGLTSSFFY